MNYSLLKSRTVWTIIFMFLVGGINAIVPILPPDIQSTVMGLLAAAAIYFKTNPSQNYAPPQA